MHEHVKLACIWGALKRLPAALSYTAAIISTLILVRPPLGPAASILWNPKLYAGGLAPFASVFGALGALLSLAQRRFSAAAAGLWGAGMAAQHVLEVTAPHDGFAKAFGPDWEARISPQIAARMVAHRWSLPARSAPEVPIEQDVICGAIHTGDPLLCDIWQPAPGTPRSGLAAIYFHSSSWHFSHKSKPWLYPFFRRLAEQGHVVMDVEYTLAPKAGLYEQVGDVKRAIAWMKAHADPYRIDPARIVLVGASSGGHLALLAAYTPNDPRFQPEGIETDTSVCGAVSYYGPLDLWGTHADWSGWFGDVLTGKTRWGKLAISTIEALGYRSGFLPPYGRWVPPRDWVAGLTGGLPEAVPEIYELGTVDTHIGPHCPPTLLLQGEHDLLIDPARIRQTHEKLLAAGVQSIYVEFARAAHNFDVAPGMWSPAAQAATYDVERFLALLAGDDHTI